MKEMKLNPEELKEAGNSVWRSVQVQPTILDENKRLVSGMITTDAIDGYNTVVDPNGARVEGYMGYRSVLFNHDPGSLIGNAEEVKKVENGLKAKWRFLPEGVSELADKVWKLYKGGWLNGYSIGFVPKGWEEDMVEDREGNEIEIVRFTDWEMKEYSLTAVPANSQALARNHEARDMFEEVNQRGTSTVFLVGNSNSQNSERDHGHNQWDDYTWDEHNTVSMGYSEGGDTKEVRTVPEYQDFPIANVDEWDESRARDQIARWAGGPDKEDIDWDKYKRGFFWYNESESDNKTAYSYPYVYIINGEPKAVDKGLYAVASYLDQGDIPDEAKSTIRNQLEKYYDKMDETPPWQDEESANDNNTTETEVNNMTDEEKRELAQLIAEELKSLEDEEERDEKLGEVKESLDSVVDRAEEALSDAEDAWAKADMVEEDMVELEEDVSELREVVEEIVEHIS